MKSITITFILLIGITNSVLGCRCTLNSFEAEIKLADEIIVGIVEEKNENTYKIRIIKEWNGRVKVRDNDTISLIQEKNSCTKRSFEVDEIYLFYIQDNSIHNCSRTMEFSKTRDIELLESKNHLKSIYYNSDIEYDSLDYERQFIIKENSGNRIDIKDKSVIYIYKGEIISKKEIPEDRNSFYPVRFYLVRRNEIENIDYIFYIENSHQDRIGEPKLSRKLLRRIKKKASREQ